ncbi:phosphoenolpyruvate-utilizing N-terminal domain-containing protein [Sinorhizobium meliloti]|nr:phosphoenolpyruvate-utilizing N-terminal domain-containing protein [Sinorhizobium meliloti]
MPSRTPAFTYLPETGEEIYHSFLGVPILRTGRALGVLVVQNKAQRNYREDEVEALETTAMVLAEMVATGELKKITKPGLELDLSRPVTIEGNSYGEGIGLGYVVLHEPRIVVTNLLNEDTEHELQRLAEALGSLRISIDDMPSRRDVSMEGEHRAVLETYRMFAHDRGWVRKLEEAIRNGLTAEAAVERVQSETKARMIRLTDPYLRERMHDFDDLANRLLRQLSGYGAKLSAADFPNDAIVVARAMGAAELLDYPRENVRGLVLEEGGGHQPCGHRRPRHGHSGGRPGGGGQWRSPKTAMRSSSTATMRRCICGRWPICSALTRRKCASVRAGRRSSALSGMSSR